MLLETENVHTLLFFFFFAEKKNISLLAFILSDYLNSVIKPHYLIHPLSVRLCRLDVRLSISPHHLIVSV